VSSATIKQHISTPLVHPLIVMAPKHILMSHRAHSLVVDVHPSIPTTDVSVRVEHVHNIVPVACRVSIVVKYPIELVVRRLRRFPGNDVWTDQATNDS
jgi:hypothetical protein